MGAEWERGSEMKARGKGGREAGRRKAAGRVGGKERRVHDSKSGGRIAGGLATGCGAVRGCRRQKGVAGWKKRGRSGSLAR